jgi:hypothetical protein
MSLCKCKFMGIPPVRGTVVDRHLDWSPHKQRRSAVSIHFNARMPVRVSFIRCAAGSLTPMLGDA